MFEQEARSCPGSRGVVRLAFLVSTILAIAAPLLAQPAKFEDVVRNLRNPDAKIRVSAVRLLREAGYAEAIVPIAPLVNDPVNDIQLEAIAAELAFYLVEPIPAKRKVAFVLEVRAEGRGPAAFDAGPLAVWPKAAPAELVDALLAAVDDENKRVRLEAIYTLGVVAGAAGAPLPDAAAARLTKALDHYDPAVRAGAARVVGRLAVKSAIDGLFKAVNDSSASVRFAAIRALGEIRDERAVQVITDQLKYYDKGEGAVAALEALSRIAHPSSVPQFVARLEDRDPKLRRAAIEGLARTGDKDAIAKLVFSVNQDDSSIVRAAMTYALHRQGYANYLARMVDYMYYAEPARQIQGYLIEIGGSVVPGVLPRLNDPDPSVRERLAEVLGAIGDQKTAVELTPLKQDSNRDVAAAATHAIERIKMTQK
jgi:HEAT repeat protein